MASYGKLYKWVSSWSREYHSISQTGEAVLHGKQYCQSQVGGSVFKHGQRENVFLTARLTSPPKASWQVSTSVVPRAEGALQTPTVSHCRKFYTFIEGTKEQMSPMLSTLQNCSSLPQTVNLTNSYLNSALKDHLVCMGTKKHWNPETDPIRREPQGRRNRTLYFRVWHSSNWPETVSDPEVTEFIMFKVGEKPHEPIVVSLVVNGQQVLMEVDKGAAVSVISITNWANLFHTGPLSSTSTISVVLHNMLEEPWSDQ